jgi:hypothetical protein
MTGELPPPPKDVHSYMLGDHSLYRWHLAICSDERTGADMRWTTIPPTHYGTIKSEAAWWALAVGTILEAAGGVEPDEIPQALTTVLGMILDDDPEPGRIVHDSLFLLPADLADKLDWERYFYPESPDE